MKEINYQKENRNHLKIYNSITGKKELFQPIHKEYVGIYVCGPTVYSHLHLGNCRTFILFDVVFRYFKHLGYKVRYVRNITDVGHLENDSIEDKISKRSRMEGIEPMEVVQKYTLSFHNLLNILNVLPPNIEPTATGHMIEQIDMIQELIKKKLAYEINGSVYFDLKKYRKFHSYGIISKNKIDQLSHKNKKLEFLQEKRGVQDFSLWKRAYSNHIMNWNSPWGKGFPGWHIECTTMSTKYLGKTFDIHGGGMDLKFPHHECELAQATGIYDTSFLAHYWMHTNMLTLNGKKMSKSTGNFLELKDIIYNNIREKAFFPNIFRFYILQYHYRNIMDFSNKGIINAEKGYHRIMRAINVLKNFELNESKNKLNNHFNIYHWINVCYQAINDDFNIPLLITYLFQAARIINNSLHDIRMSHISLLKKYMTYFVFDILGIQEIKKYEEKESYKKLKILTERLIKFRIEVRKQNNWIISDRIRKELSYIGVLLHDEKFF
jgi:cysteinyl-tRNA synthetase